MDRLYGSVKRALTPKKAKKKKINELSRFREFYVLKSCDFTIRFSQSSFEYFHQWVVQLCSLQSPYETKKFETIGVSLGTKTGNSLKLLDRNWSITYCQRCRFMGRDEPTVFGCVRKYRKPELQSSIPRVRWGGVECKIMCDEDCRKK